MYVLCGMRQGAVVCLWCVWFDMCGMCGMRHVYGGG